MLSGEMGLDCVLGRLLSRNQIGGNGGKALQPAVFKDIPKLNDL